jgi:hypothetical protein
MGGPCEALRFNDSHKNNAGWRARFLLFLLSGNFLSYQAIEHLSIRNRCKALARTAISAVLLYTVAYTFRYNVGYGPTVFFVDKPVIGGSASHTCVNFDRIYSKSAS